MRRHGTYPRKTPPGTRIARWYCRQAHQTFSLLPECLAAGVSGTLAAVEAVVRSVEHAPSLESAADALRPEVELPGAVRWTRRRVRRVTATLTALRGLMPERFESCPATVHAFGARLGVESVLVTLREVASDYLHQLPTPLGFSRRSLGRGEPSSKPQHSTGPDPPRPPR